MSLFCRCSVHRLSALSSSNLGGCAAFFQSFPWPDESALPSQEPFPRPADVHRGALALSASIGEFDRGAGTLEQRLGNEKPQSQPAAACSLKLPSRHIGFADPVDDLGGKARPVVGDHNPHSLIVPPPFDGDL